jgi:hypothetical protein
VKVEAYVLLFIAVFFAVVAGIYWLWGYEYGGVAMLIGSALLGLLPGSYYYYWSRRMRPRPEDRDDATLEDGAGVVGSFPSSSIWPFVFGVAASLVGLSLIFGAWTAIVGFVVAVSAAIGVITESRRGGVT